jgi:hypothetical protein
MNKFKFITCVIVASVVSYFAGANSENIQHEKDYQAACILSDCCRNMVDNLGLEAEEIYYEYVDNIDCDPRVILTREDILDYQWSY